MILKSGGVETELRAGVTKVERTMAGVPVYGSLSDPRMGTNSFDLRCATCDCSYAGMGSKTDDCPGHMGHIELCQPVYHCGFIDQVVRILRCVCFKCSRLLLDENSAKDKALLKIRDPEIRFRYIHSRCNRTKVVCANSSTSDVKDFFSDFDNHNYNSTNNNDINGINGEGNPLAMRTSATIMNEMATSKSPPCGCEQPKFRREGMTVYITYPTEGYEGHAGREELSASDALRVLERISDEDASLLGFDPAHARPDWMLVSVVAVPPPHVRPTVTQDDIQSEDDLTFILATIVKINSSLEKAKERGESVTIVREQVQALQTTVTAFFDNERDDTTRATQKTGRPLKTLRSRLKGKEGRLRGNLMGKRVDFTARSGEWTSYLLCTD
jgi:DNA-directed RNA polymerase II subunit RPB1